MNRNRATRNRANQNPVNQNQVNRIRRKKANRTRATPATAGRTALATRDHPVVATPAKAIQAAAKVVNPIVPKVNRPVRRVRANPKANRIPKIQAAIAIRCRAILRQATRSPVIQAAAVPRLPVFRAKAIARVIVRAIRKANPKASLRANPTASHPAAMVLKAGRVAIVQATARAKATAFHGRPVTQPADLAATRKAAQAADQRATLVVTHHRPPVTRMIRQQVNHTIHQPANLIVRA